MSRQSSFSTLLVERSSLVLLIILNGPACLSSSKVQWIAFSLWLATSIMTHRVDVVFVNVGPLDVGGTGRLAIDSGNGQHIQTECVVSIHKFNTAYSFWRGSLSLYSLGLKEPSEKRRSCILAVVQSRSFFKFQPNGRDERKTERIN